MINRERVRKMFVHYRRRLKNNCWTDEDVKKWGFYAYRTTGTPCSCEGCAGEKYSRKVKHKNKLLEEELV